jgi:hypothetical protein
MVRTAEYLIETADRCFRLANAGRRLAEDLDNAPELKEQHAHLAAAGRKMVNELEAMSRELMAKAVELDTVRQKAKPGSFGP